MKISTDLKNRLRSVITESIKNQTQKAVIVSAHDLSESQIKTIVSKFGELPGRDVTVVINPALIAGFIVKIGSSEYDHSLKSQISNNFENL